MRTEKAASSALEEPYELAASVGEIRELELIRVETENAVRIWNELMMQEHPRGRGLWLAVKYAT